MLGLPLDRRQGQREGPAGRRGSKLTADEIRAWITDAKGMTAKTKARAQAGDEGLHAAERGRRRARRVPRGAEEEVAHGRDVRLIRSPISVAGMVLTTISAVVFLVVFSPICSASTRTRTSASSFSSSAGAVRPRAPADSARRLGRATAPRRRQTAVGRCRWPRIDLNDPAQRHDGGRSFSADDRQRRHRLAGGVQRRRVHGFGRILRPGLPYADEAGVRRSRQAARAREVRRVPRRSGRSSFAKAKLRDPAAGRSRSDLSAADRAEPDKLLSARETCEQCHLGRQLPRRQSGERRRVRRRREEHRVGDDPSAARRRRRGRLAAVAAFTGT